MQASDFLLLRILASGEPDTSFGPPAGGGTVRVDFGGIDVLHDLVPLADGGVIAVGTHQAQRFVFARTDIAVTRLTAGGELDPTFGSGGKAVTHFDSDHPTETISAALAPSGRLVVAGPAVVPTRATDFGVLRYLLTDGSPLPHVAGAHVFYNNSAFGRSIASEKVALLPGQSPRLQNVTSYVRGINGVMVDLMNPLGAELTAEDFAFRAAAGKPGSAWTDGPRPESVVVQRGAGAGGSDRVTLTWADYNPRSAAANQAVANGWLEVTVRAAPTTGLAAPYVFRFGNLIGETGAPTPEVGGGWRVDSRDAAATRAAQGRAASLESAFDFDRNGRVNVFDVAVARTSVGNVLAAPQEPDVRVGPGKRRGAYLASLD
jgi:uncharacterized delta-60 repeat protein